MNSMTAKEGAGKVVLVTGGAGYIGSVLVRQLLRAGYSVRVADSLMHGGEALLEVAAQPGFSFVKADIRDRAAMQEAVRGCWGIAHLAAIVGDPACAREPQLAKSVNLEGTRELYRIAEAAGCERFVFASTCSNYGKMQDRAALVDEDSPLLPVSLYAETKVEAEKFLRAQPGGNRCKPTSLRFATVYGLSPRMRFDLTVNEFTMELKTEGRLSVYGEQFWRPYCHVRDLARSVVAVLGAPAEKVAFETFNVGDTGENYTKEMVVKEITARLPGTLIEYVQQTEDPRDYRVNFAKIAEVLGFAITRTVPDGIDEIISMLEMGLIGDPRGQRYRN